MTYLRERDSRKDPRRGWHRAIPFPHHKRPLLRYAMQRLVAMPGILLGVILLTFILFNVVGGSPAASVLGKSASLQSLEEFDERNGFNKPLLVGRWTSTRVFAAPDFNRGPSPWTANEFVSIGVTDGSRTGLAIK